MANVTNKHVKAYQAPELNIVQFNAKDVLNVSQQSGQASFMDFDSTWLS